MGLFMESESDLLFCFLFFLSPLSNIRNKEYFFDSLNNSCSLDT